MQHGMVVRQPVAFKAPHKCAAHPCKHTAHLTHGLVARVHNFHHACLWSMHVAARTLGITFKANVLEFDAAAELLIR